MPLMRFAPERSPTLRGSAVWIALRVLGLSTAKQADLLCRISAYGMFDDNVRFASCRIWWFFHGMAYFDPTIDRSPEHLDSIRRTTFERSGTRPDGKLRRSAAETQKAYQRASGRLRQAAYRCSLDTKRKPESSVVAMALLAAAVTRLNLKQLDADSVSIITAAFSDLMERGYERSEIEAVFRRFRKMMKPRPDIASNQ
jgi:hypothetical protein